MPQETITSTGSRRCDMVGGGSRADGSQMPGTPSLPPPVGQLIEQREHGNRHFSTSSEALARLIDDEGVE